MDWDYIIVGGGSAGSVLANRLSARSSNKVLLLEAGMDTPHGKVPAAILDSYPGTAYLNPAFTWNKLKVTTEVIPHNRPDEPRPKLRTYEQARVLGGGSSINGQLANRGAPTDYDEWHARGATGWNWDNVLPFFKKVERDMDFDGPWHGNEGRIPVRRIFPDLWPEHAKAAGETFKAAGYKFLIDQNAEFEDGYFPITISNVYERRVSAAIGYLDPGTRMRENLTISTDTQVTALLFDGLRCIGVKALVGGRETEFRGREVILSSGAIHSPAHLLRAGIGPAGHLRDLGIEVRAAVPGVGQRLQDHPAVAMAAFIKPFARIVNDYTRRHIYLALRYSSQAGRHSARRHVHRGDQQDVVARGGRTDRLVHHHGVQDVFGDRRGEARLARLARRADRRFQPAVGPARPGADDGRRAAVWRDASDAERCRR